MTDLSEPEELFLQLWSQSRDRIESWRAAFPDRDHRRRPVSERIAELLKRPEVRARWEELELKRAERLGFSRESAIRMLLDVWHADVNEVVSLRRGCCRHCHGADHRYQWTEVEYADALAKAAANKPEPLPPPDIAGGFGFDHAQDPHPDCPQCQGDGDARLVMRDTTQLSEEGRRLYLGVRERKGGLEVVIADRQKALELACRLAGFLGGGIEQLMGAAFAGVMRAQELKDLDPEAAARAYQSMLTGRST